MALLTRIHAAMSSLPEADVSCAPNACLLCSLRSKFLRNSTSKWRDIMEPLGEGQNQLNIWVGASVGGGGGKGEEGEPKEGV